MPAPTKILHGVFIEIFDTGVLLEGSNGIGKSALALDLVSRGHKLIADDAPEFRCCATATINGNCPAPLQDFIEVFGLGMLNIPAMFGTDAVKKSCQLQLLLTLIPATQFKPAEDNHLKSSLQRRTVLDVVIPAIELPVMPEQNMAVMVESTVRNHVLRSAGYNATEEFVRKQYSFLERKK